MKDFLKSYEYVVAIDIRIYSSYLLLSMVVANWLSMAEDTDRSLR